MEISSSLRIGMYAGSWPQNIGNAFFDFGAESIIRLAFPKAEIFRTGGAVHWMFNNSGVTRNGLLGKITRKAFPNYNPINGNSLELGEIADLDVLVFAGMSLSKEFVRNNARTMLEANSRGISILGLGSGASSYTQGEASYFSDFFSKLNHSGIITRDSDTFAAYSDKIKIIKSGIDCAFFLPEYFTPPKLSLSNYDVLAFDFGNAPKQILKLGRQVIRTHHDLWGPLPKKYTNKPNTLVSDVPEDYLSLYANCDVTYSDRVHACVASLAYGKSAQLFSGTRRKALFTNMGVPDITLKPVLLDENLLENKKTQQVEITKSTVLELISDK